MSGDPASYIEGIPVKIAEKYRPPRKVSLPLSCNYNINTEVLIDEYDFVVENETLKWLEERRKYRENLLNQRKENVKIYEEVQQKRIEEELLRQQRLKDEAEKAKEEEERKLKDEQERLMEDKTQIEINEDEDSGNQKEKDLKCESSNDQQDEDNAAVKEDSELENEEVHADAETLNSEKIHGPLNPDTRNLYKPIFINGDVTNFQGSMTSSVLIPTQCAPQTYHERAQANLNSNINFADFEGDANDPFDSAALKSINDMEELAKVLQSSDISTKASNINSSYLQSRAYPYSNTQFPYMNYQQTDLQNHPYISSYGTQTTSPSNTTSMPLNRNSEIQYHTSGYQHQSYIPWKNVVPSPNSGTNDNLKYNPYAYRMQPGSIATPSCAISNNVPVSLAPASVCSHSSSISGAQIPISTTQMSVNKIQDLEDFYVRYYSQHNKPVITGVRSGDSTPTTSFQSSRMIRSSSSVPDLTAMEDSEVSTINSAYQSSRTSLKASSSNVPARPSSTGGVEGFHKTSLSSGTPKNIPKARLPDPFAELTNDAQALVQSMSEMGFPRPRVARAVQKLGTDHKRLLEVLLILQSFQDNGEDEYRAEIAFYFYMGDVERVREFLEAAKTLLDLGFSDENVTELLLKHGNDKDKCLEELIS